MSEHGREKRLSAEDLFRQHARFVARFLVRLGVHHEDLDDVVQEVFLVVHAQGGYVPGPAKPTSYLGSIALRAASTQRRRRNMARGRESSDDLTQLHSADRDPQENLERRDAVRDFEIALASLSPVLRATLLLADQEGESCTSIAASMDVPLGTVYWRLHQARRAFKRAVLAQREQEEERVVGSSIGKGVPS
jgi:RNA polymerase sigma-70 factor (ECF subfamily)